MKLSATVKHTTFKACKLTAMKEYIFRISAENQYGIGEPAEHPPIVAKYSFGKYLKWLLLYKLCLLKARGDIKINRSHNKSPLFQILLVLQAESLHLKSPGML